MSVNFIAILFLAGLILCALIALSGRGQIRAARQKGLYPPPGQPPTMEHVRQLAEAGQKIAAIKLYRQISNASLKEAKDAVDKIAAGGRMADSGGLK